RVLRLEDALRSARERQPQLVAARAASEAAAAKADEAKAPLLPQISANAQYQRSGGSGTSFRSNGGSGPLGVGGGTVTSPGSNFFSVGASASQLVYDFGQTSGRWRAAQAAAGSQRESERSTAAQIALGVQTAYYNARANKDLVRVARENFANQDAHLRQIEAFVKIGTRPEIDLAQARTDRANAEVQLINAQNGYETSKAQLNQASGIEADTAYDVADETAPAVQGEDGTIDELLPEALRARPDLAALDEQIRAQDLAAGAVRGAYFPSLGLAASTARSGTSLDSTTYDWTAGAILSWPLFQGGLTRAQEREAQANVEVARAQSATLRLQVRVDVEAARLAVRAAKAGLGAAGEALVNARERLRLAEGRYQAGAGSAIELGDAQVALTTAAAQRVQAEYNLATSRAQLVRALGREVPGV
ncbi:MAG TPA: TolC family protein, partial [Anaeromyxobacteraceae bacterium]|nr:TolC family protein [Anaeromyxobacteraceae bacterium]